MPVSLRFAPSLAESFLAHLLLVPEQVAFLRGLSADEQCVFDVEDMLLIAPEDLDSGSWHVNLGDRARRDVLSWASSRGDILIEAHSHGRLGDPAAFSSIDVAGLEEWVPHVRWRLGSRPYGALVLGAETFDGLAWLDEDVAPRLLSRLDLGGRTLEATGRTLRRLGVRDD
jgi:hypothetical protein